MTNLQALRGGSGVRVRGGMEAPAGLGRVSVVHEVHEEVHEEESEVQDRPGLGLRSDEDRQGDAGDAGGPGRGPVGRSSIQPSTARQIHLSQQEQKPGIGPRAVPRDPSILRSSLFPGSFISRRVSETVTVVTGVAGAAAQVQDC